MKVCRNCGWCRGKTEIGASWCNFRETLIFETDPACSNFSTDRKQDVRWVSYNEPGSSCSAGIQELSVYRNKPTLFRNFYRDTLSESGCDSLCAAQQKWLDDNDVMCFVEALLPMINDIKDTNKLLKITVEMVDPC